MLFLLLLSIRTTSCCGFLVEIIKEGLVTFFDLDVVRNFLKVEDKSREIAMQYVDKIES
jgi:hypothetical protein